MVNKEEIRHAIADLGLSGAAVCAHGSLRSFGHVDGGADTLVQAFLDEGCTLLVPTFTYWEVPPPPNQRWARNGMDYDSAPNIMPEDISRFSTGENTLSIEDMGQIPAAVLKRPERVRGNHPINSFAAVGPLASALIAGQQPLHVYAPLEELIRRNGSVVLMGVDLTKLTLLHLAENQAGRALFRRWALTPEGQTVETEVGSCSDGFNHFALLLEPITRQTIVGTSVWRVLPARATCELAATTIRQNPEITRCTDSHCERCPDAILGGPSIV